MSSIASLITRKKNTHEDRTDLSSNYVGFAHLSNQVHRKIAKRGFQFTMMIVGEHGLGKTTLLKSLFRTDFHREPPPIPRTLPTTVNIEASTVHIEELGIRVRLTMIHTPGYGDCIDDTKSIEALVNYIDQQFERYYNDEYGVRRQTIVDQRVHCLLYLVSSLNRGLKPLDIQCMKLLQNKVNLIPIITKADALTVAERFRLKQTILDQLSAHQIHVYQIPEDDSEDDEFLQATNRQLRNSFPFAVMASKEFVEIEQKPMRARVYPWGSIDTEHSTHSDLNKLRTMLITHMHDLQEVTDHFHYERYRLKRMQSKQ